jgi:hypothetical protein
MSLQDDVDVNGLGLRRYDGVPVDGYRCLLEMEIDRVAKESRIGLTDTERAMVLGDLICAEWSSTHTHNPNTPEEEVVEFEKVHKKFADSALALATADCTSFIRRAGPELLKGIAPDSAGHDFWLTRNHHGAGFWDRDELDADDRGKKLTDIAHAFGEKDLVLGDDGLTYIE